MAEPDPTRQMLESYRSGPGIGNRLNPTGLAQAATLFGIEADEAIHCLLDVMSAGLPYTAITRTVHIHPTVAELIPTLLGKLQPLA